MEYIVCSVKQNLVINTETVKKNKYYHDQELQKLIMQIQKLRFFIAVYNKANFHKPGCCDSKPV